MKNYKKFVLTLEKQAQITSKYDAFYQKYGKVMIKGGGSDTGGIKEHNPPHFHIELNSGGDIRIVIPDNIDDEITSLDVTLNHKIKKDLKNWFVMKSSVNKEYNNYNMLKNVWNELNENDDNVDIFNNITKI